MSFGFGPSDFITISVLAWKVYRCCRDSSEEFQRVAKDVKLLHISLRETEELLEEYNWELSPKRRDHLELIKEACSENLHELQTLIEKYDRLATPSQRVWDQMRWGLQDVSQLKQRIINTSTKLDAFNNILSNSSHRIIIKKLDKYRNEVRGGLHQHSVVSTASVDSIDTKEAWESLRRELETIGISKTVINENKSFITGWFREALARGELEEEAPSELSHSLSAPSVLSGTTAVSYAQCPLAPLTTAATVGPPSSSVTLSNPFEKYHETRLPPSPGASTGTSHKPLTLRRKSRLNSLLSKITRADQGLLEAASDGDAQRVTQLIRRGANVDVKDRWGWAPLSMAAYGGYVDVARELLDAGAEMEYTDVDGDSPLDLATNRGHTAVVLVLQEELTRRAVESG